MKQFFLFFFDASWCLTINLVGLKVLSCDNEMIVLKVWGCKQTRVSVSVTSSG